MSRELRFEASAFRLGDFIDHLAEFDLIQAGEAASYILETASQGSDQPAAKIGRPIDSLHLVDEILLGKWYFLPFGVFGDAEVPCADGSLQELPDESDELNAWASSADPSECVGFIVGLEEGEIVLRRAFSPWAFGGDCFALVLEEGDFLEAPMEGFAARFAEAHP